MTDRSTRPPPACHEINQNQDSRDAGDGPAEGQLHGSVSHVTPWAELVKGWGPASPSVVLGAAILLSRRLGEITRGHGRAPTTTEVAVIALMAGLPSHIVGPALHRLAGLGPVEWRLHELWNGDRLAGGR